MPIGGAKMERGEGISNQESTAIKKENRTKNN